MDKYRFCWFVAGLGWVALVIYLSIADLHIPQGPVIWSDKLNHFLAYGFLIGWFGQLNQPGKARVQLAVGLIVLGVVLELLQGRLPYRWFDVFDAVANTGGVMFACLLLYFGADRIFSWLVHRIG